MSGQVLRDGAIVDPLASRKLPSPEGKPTVTVLDYGSGNVRSAVRALERAGAEVILSSKPEDVLNASAALAHALRLYASHEAQAASGLRSSLSEPGGVSDIRRARAVSEAVGIAASRAALLLEVADIIGHGGETSVVGRTLAEAIRRAGLAPNALSPDLRAAAPSVVSLLNTLPPFARAPPSPP